MKSRRRLAVPIAALFAAFAAGMLVMAALVYFGPPKPVDADDTNPVPPVSDTSGRKSTAAGSGGTKSVPMVSDTGEVRTHGTAGDIPHAPLHVPIDGADPRAWRGAFSETRDGSRPHEAVDILAPRNTPIHAAADGTIAKLFDSKAGGHTIYQFDDAGRLCYYYAHLERYAAGLHPGQRVSRGEVIGYVGTSGNAPPNTPHLHFAVFELDADKHWWKGRAIDPYELFTARR